MLREGRQASQLSEPRAHRDVVGEPLYTACGFETVEPIEHSFPYGLLLQRFACSRALIRKLIVGRAGQIREPKWLGGSV